MSGAGADERLQRATYLDLARAVLTREYLVFVRYPANAVGGIVVALVFVSLMFQVGEADGKKPRMDASGGIAVRCFS